MLSFFSRPGACRVGAVCGRWVPAVTPSGTTAGATAADAFATRSGGFGFGAASNPQAGSNLQADPENVRYTHALPSSVSERLAAQCE
jgi:hypothetical protein